MVRRVNLYESEKAQERGKRGRKGDRGKIYMYICFLVAAFQNRYL
jgi:hypothetical protein